MKTLRPGALTIMTAYPDPPFDVAADGELTGFDIQLMRAACGRLGLELNPLSFEGENFNDIFDSLADGRCDAVISGTTITPERAARVRFSRPYLKFNQGVAINRRLTPNVSSTKDLRGLTAGIQKGNTSDLVARKLLESGDIAAIEYYPYRGIETALDDLEAGTIGLVIKLHPVISALTAKRPDLSVAFEVPTGEELGIAYAPENSGLCDAVDQAIESLKASGDFAELKSKWLG